MPPSALGRCRLQILFAGLAAMLVAGAGSAAPPEPVTLKGHAGWVGGVAFSPDGTTLATASADKTAKLWDAAKWKPTATLKGHDDYVVAVAFAPDGKSLATGSFDHAAKVWDAKTGAVLHTLKGHKGAVLAVLMGQDEVVTGGIDGEVRLWNGSAEVTKATLHNHKSWVNALAYDRGRPVIASASSDNTVALENGRATPLVLRPKAAEVRSLSFSPDGKLLAAGTRYGITKVWDVATGEEVASLKGKHTGDVWGVAFSADGQLLAAADGDWNTPSDVVLYDTTTWKERGRLKHTSEVLCVAWHPKKPALAAGAWDKTVRVWDVSDLVKDK